ncbi:hypothetical protein GCM10009809_27160 [Isoptericola hypogeus]|uniref:Uncharacterized protein n=1 Tax=Isoptericola hypogeus TaxID=300179 RepID=A0ABN2JKD8_9MICO
MERRRAAVVPRRELAPGQASRRTGVVEGPRERLAVEVADELDDDGRPGGVEREQVGFVGTGPRGDREDLLAQQPVDVALHDGMGRGADTRFTGDLGPTGLDEEGPLGVDLEQWHATQLLVRITTPAAGSRAQPRPVG